ncbi:hypothetical protein TcasGA2_TC008041 [Tribolium castaneum]|uniref:Uncharacterized protein n=1 Tax=Tribolium castaneum TaxID=7070 RepID=D1ZZG5_TRICA|nr:hypothetical protein TcasGA2_TC008041 [Tribolium castaneum]
MADDTAFISNICKMVYEEKGGGERLSRAIFEQALCNSNNNFEKPDASFDNLTCVLLLMSCGRQCRIYFNYKCSKSRDFNPSHDTLFLLKLCSFPEVFRKELQLILNKNAA